MSEKLTDGRLIDDLTDEEAYHLVRPRREYTEHEHEMAKMRFLLSRLYEDAFSLAYDLLERLQGKREEQRIVDRMTKEAELMIGACDRAGDDGKLEDALLDRYRVGGDSDYLRKEAEFGWHGGDCTAFCCSCSRCWADEFYNVDTTTWSSKHAGHALEHKAMRYVKSLPETKDVPV